MFITNSSYHFACQKTIQRYSIRISSYFVPIKILHLLGALQVFPWHSIIDMSVSVIAKYCSEIVCGLTRCCGQFYSTWPLCHFTLWLTLYACVWWNSNSSRVWANMCEGRGLAIAQRAEMWALSDVTHCTGQPILRLIHLNIRVYGLAHCVFLLGRKGAHLPS